MNAQEFQTIVDVIALQHDMMYEIIIKETPLEPSVVRDELILRKFLTAAAKKGFKVDLSYKFEDKLKKLGY